MWLVPQHLGSLSELLYMAAGVKTSLMVWRKSKEKNEIEILEHLMLHRTLLRKMHPCEMALCHQW